MFLKHCTTSSKLCHNIHMYLCSTYSNQLYNICVKVIAVKVTTGVNYNDTKKKNFEYL